MNLCSAIAACSLYVTSKRDYLPRPKAGLRSDGVWITATKGPILLLLLLMQCRLSASALNVTSRFQADAGVEVLDDDGAQ